MSRLRLAGYIGIAFSLGVILTLQLVGWARVQGYRAGFKDATLVCAENIATFAYATGQEQMAQQVMTAFCLEEQ